MYQFNYVDFVVFFIFIFFIYEGIKYGFIVTLAHLVSFFISLVVAIRYYPFATDSLIHTFSVGPALARPIAFVSIAIISETVLGYVFAHLLKFIPKKIIENKLIKILGIIPSFGEAIIIISFIVGLIFSLPIATKIKNDVDASYFSDYILSYVNTLEDYQKDIFGDAFEESLTYLTVEPGSSKRIFLQTKPISLAVDEISEKEIFDLVNAEREAVGVKTLVWFDEALPVARNHATDMWQRSYFAHLSPDGEDVAKRLENAGVNYFAAGENLALAPTVKTAHTGLMNSEGHRRNILDPVFDKVAIGVIDNGIFGKMFVQIFIRQ